jgi:hypothetical protein
VKSERAPATSRITGLRNFMAVERDEQPWKYPVTMAKID